MKTDTGKIIFGVFAGLFLFFIVLPMAVCGGCGALMVGTAADQQMKEQKLTEERGPAIELSNISYKIESSGGTGRFSDLRWKVDITNNRDHAKSLTVYAKFLDASGHVVSEDIEFGVSVPANSTHTVSKKTMENTNKANQVTDLLVETK